MRVHGRERLSVLISMMTFLWPSHYVYRDTLVYHLAPKAKPEPHHHRLARGIHPATEHDHPSHFH